MARFSFSLQSVLNIKEKMETQAKNAFFTAQNQLNKEEEKMQELVTRRDQYEDAVRGLLSGPLSVRDIEDNKNAIVVMGNYIEEQKKHVEAARQIMEQARFRMIEFTKERKTYEVLREKAFEEFLQEESRAESKSVDELVSYTYSTK